MSDIEEMIAVRAAPAQAMRALLAPSRMKEWVASDVSLNVQTAGERLLPGDRFRIAGLLGPAFDYQVEAASEREVVFSFEGSWRGEERWSFVADGPDTIVRRSYRVHEAPGLGAIAWRTVGRAVVMVHFKLELSRFKDLLEREPAVRAEIESPAVPNPQPGETPPRRPFEIDEG